MAKTNLTYDKVLKQLNRISKMLDIRFWNIVNEMMAENASPNLYPMCNLDIATDKEKTRIHELKQLEIKLRPTVDYKKRREERRAKRKIEREQKGLQLKMN